MSLACLVCHGMSSPSHSFRSYSVSSGDGDNQCIAVLACFTRKVIAVSGTDTIGTSKVAPLVPLAAAAGADNIGAPRLQRSRAVSRDLVRDWNFDNVVLGN